MAVSQSVSQIISQFVKFFQVIHCSVYFVLLHKFSSSTCRVSLDLSKVNACEVQRLHRQLDSGLSRGYGVIGINQLETSIWAMARREVAVLRFVIMVMRVFQHPQFVRSQRSDQVTLPSISMRDLNSLEELIFVN